MPTALTSSLRDSREERHGTSFGQEFLKKQPRAPELPEKHVLYFRCFVPSGTTQVFLFVGSVGLSQAS